MEKEEAFKTSNIAIFWDIENVTPKLNSLFVDGLIEFAESRGKVVISNAYADWSKPGFRRLGPDLAQHHFYMVHLPYRRNQRSKNGADIQLVSDALDSLRVYEHIDTYLLVTGDSDFRPLLRPLRRLGKTIHIICDIRTASQDLLMIADSFQDYHELIPSSDEDDDEQSDEAAEESKSKRGRSRRGTDSKNSESSGKVAQKAERQDRSYWFMQLVEAIQALEQEDKTINLSTIHIKMRMLNPGFDERKLGFYRWSQFIAAAVKHNYISVIEGAEDDDSEQALIRVVENQESSSTITLQRAFQELIAIMQQEQGYKLYSYLNNELRKREIDVRELGYNQFKKFMASAEARGLVETKLDNMAYYARLPEPAEQPKRWRTLTQIGKNKKD